jgi:hypothetical protein
MRKTILTATAVLIGGLLADLLLFGSDSTAQAQSSGTTNEVGVPSCNNWCRLRQHFKYCGGGSTAGKCLYYEQGVCKHCTGTGSCEATADWSAWACKDWNNHDVTFYESDETSCVGHCPCGNTDTTIRQSAQSPMSGTMFQETITNCRWFSEF